MDMEQDKIIRPVVLLGGPIGSGKTTLAQELVRSASLPTVYIEGDKFWSFVAKPDKTIERKQHFKMLMASMLAAAIPFAMNGYEVILDFSIPPWFLTRAKKIAEARNVPLEYIVLLPDEQVCAHRASTRAEGVIEDYGPYHDFYLSFKEMPEHTISDDQINVTELSKLVHKKRGEGAFKII